MQTCNADILIQFARKKKIFSTQNVMDYFKIKKQNAAACIAICRIKGVLERGKKPANSDKDQSSRWIFVNN